MSTGKTSRGLRHLSALRWPHLQVKCSGSGGCGGGGCRVVAAVVVVVAQVVMVVEVN